MDFLTPTHSHRKADMRGRPSKLTPSMSIVFSTTHIDDYNDLSSPVRSNHLIDGDSNGMHFRRVRPYKNVKNINSSLGPILSGGSRGPGTEFHKGQGREELGYRRGSLLSKSNMDFEDDGDRKAREGGMESPATGRRRRLNSQRSDLHLENSFVQAVKKVLKQDSAIPSLFKKKYKANNIKSRSRSRRGSDTEIVEDRGFDDTKLDVLAEELENSIENNMDSSAKNNKKNLELEHSSISHIKNEHLRHFVDSKMTKNTKERIRTFERFAFNSAERSTTNLKTNLKQFRGPKNMATMTVSDFLSINQRISLNKATHFYDDKKKVENYNFHSDLKSKLKVTLQKNAENQGIGAIKLTEKIRNRRRQDDAVTKRQVIHKIFNLTEQKFELDSLRKDESRRNFAKMKKELKFTVVSGKEELFSRPNGASKKGPEIKMNLLQITSLGSFSNLGTYYNIQEASNEKHLKTSSTFRITKIPPNTKLKNDPATMKNTTPKVHIQIANDTQFNMQSKEASIDNMPFALPFHLDFSPRDNKPPIGSLDNSANQTSKYSQKNSRSHQTLFTRFGSKNELNQDPAYKLRQIMKAASSIRESTKNNRIKVESLYDKIYSKEIKKKNERDAANAFKRLEVLRFKYKHRGNLSKVPKVSPDA